MSYIGRDTFFRHSNGADFNNGGHAFGSNSGKEYIAGHGKQGPNRSGDIRVKKLMFIGLLLFALRLPSMGWMMLLLVSAGSHDTHAHPAEERGSISPLHQIAA